MYIGYAQYQRSVERRIDKRIIRRLLAGIVIMSLLCVIGYEAIYKWGELYGQGNTAVREISEPMLPAACDVAQLVNNMKPKTAPLPVRDASNPLIVIDAGHGGEDAGCSRDGIEEKNINLSIAVKIKEQLNALGYEVLMTREGDETITLEERVRFANENNASLYISIHQNACEEKESDVSGIETWFVGNDEAAGEGVQEAVCEDSKRLAQLVQIGAVSGSGATDRGLQQSRELYVLRETTMPSCLLETSFLSNKAEREDIGDETYQEKIAVGIARNIDYYFHPKTMYLTFDDGPSVENTSAILDALREHGIKATFFLIGENVEKHPEIARRIAQEGHTIGIHCYSHEYEALYESVDAYVADFEKARQAVYEATGVEAKLFRFPGGSINSYNKRVYKDIIEAMTEKGYVYFDWNASLEDAVGKSTPELLLANAKESTLGRKKVVMLAHDIVYNTTLCINELLEQFPEYQMLPLTEEVTPIQF